MILLDNVLLSEIRPDPGNPRADFGDLDALAASFELNAARNHSKAVVKAVRDA